MFFDKKKKIDVKAPALGKVVELDEVPDEVFAGRMLGDGFAVIPEDGTFKAPVSGKIGSFFPTGHAFGIEGEDGLEVLVHIGIDTVELKGEGFKA